MLEGCGGGAFSRLFLTCSKILESHSLMVLSVTTNEPTYTVFVTVEPPLQLQMTKCAEGRAGNRRGRHACH